MKQKQVTSVDALANKTIATGKTHAGWIEASAADVPIALKLTKPSVTDWVQKVTAYPRAVGCLIVRGYYSPK
jgi:hypothetical protein